MAFRMNGGWISFKDNVAGTGSTKYLAKSSATIRVRFSRPVQLIASEGGVE